MGRESGLTFGPPQLHSANMNEMSEVARFISAKPRLNHDMLKRSLQCHGSGDE